MVPELEFRKTFDFTTRVLKLIGIPCCFDPYPATLRKKLWTNAGFITSYLILSYCVIGQLVNVTLLLIGHRKTNGVIEEIATQAACTGYCIIGLIQMYGLAYHRNQLASIINDCGDLWKDAFNNSSTDRPISDNFFRPTVAIMKFAAVNGIVTASAFNFLPVAEMIFNRWQTGEWHRQLPYVIWYPFDKFGGWWYYPVYVFEIYGGYVVAGSNVGVECIFCLLCAHLSLQLKLLKTALEELVEPQNHDGMLICQKNIDEKLQTLIRRHQNLLSYQNSINAVFGLTFFLNLVADSVIMCAQGFLIITANYYVVIKMTLFIGVCLVEIFFVCYYGNEVMEHSLQLATAAYNCKWYQQIYGNTQFGKKLILLILRAQHPIILMAWKFWPITINTFGMILNASWSYFTLLRTLIT
ncbi:odorant receptor 4-like [Malaya genurostris]|uniref:odorant receptor 4-like n=1 Tax=Malaya genurostris TaxID=325434 RepID=UPI0026F3EE4C|nr:odorant receptor 4-like [Malaya genurostris]